jgi:hypothetical protein
MALAKRSLIESIVARRYFLLFFVSKAGLFGVNYFFAPCWEK